ncbi:hypothetical protein AVEN_229353-1 [Araneus ventricosus]|uniref:Uncharacterized protein n=1 Tax=Araneus ventricosus TaxID=182803 RepID=A0A4Y2I2R4_ARAVE|nr:hypothetical protein AVEN_229353-1 [Araneus ventricosus]
MGPKKGATKSDKDKGGKEGNCDKMIGSASGANAKEFLNELQFLLDRIDPNDYVDGIDDMIKKKLLDLNVYSNDLIKNRSTYGKPLRNELTTDYLVFLLGIIKDLCTRVNELNSSIFDLKKNLDESESVHSKAKIWTTGRENISLGAKLETTQELSISVNNIISKINELKDKGAEVFREVIPNILRSEREAT